MALKVTDLAATIASLQAAGVHMIDSVGRPGARHSMIAFPHPSSLGGMLVHLVQRQDL
jgi:methylmalonyl-CoA/ethylmalonyl-CoA epimerase